MTITACNYGAHDFVHAPDSPFGGLAGTHVHICAACEATYIDPGDGPCFRCRPTPDPAARSHRPDAQTAQIAEEADE